MIAFIERFSALASAYDVVLSDVWGVMHDGLAAYPEACEALARYREGGGTVILITNAPRPGEAVMRQIDRFGVPRGAYDGIISSGDVTRGMVAQRPGQAVFHLGPERDRSIFTGLDVRFAPVTEADYVVCSGLFNDEAETAEDYRDLLNTMLARSLFMVCGNPDVVVERGGRLVYCAGAVADLYDTMGGKVFYAGKPHRPIYAEALRRAESVRGGPTVPGCVLAIGDSVRTDVKGAVTLGVDCLFVTAGIHAEEFGGREDPSPEALERFFDATGLWPKAVTRKLRW